MTTSLNVAAGKAYSAMEVSTLFADNMVLQQGIQIPVWGRANPGSNVQVNFNRQVHTVTTNSEGRWMVRLEPMDYDSTGQQLAIRCTETADSIIVRNILIGEVWLASGQSNMAYEIGHAINGKQEIEAADFPLIREFNVFTTVAEKPLEKTTGKWDICCPENASKFSALAYFFARGLHKHLKVPIGIINSSVSGTLAEAWMSKEALETRSEFRPIFERFENSKSDYSKKMSEILSLQKNSANAAGSQHDKMSPAPNTKDIPVDPVTQTTMPSGLYNAKIAPLIPFAIRGVIWWQGEYNSERCEQYELLFPALIKDWREQWNQGDFPFLFVQLQNYDIQPQPNAAHYDELREAQLHTFQRVINTGMAVACDVGDSHDVHPPNKQAVAERLVLIARARVYGEKTIEWSGPIYDRMEIKNTSIILRFSHIGDGLVAKNNVLTEFEIAGGDRKFYPAQAEISSDTVVVSCNQVQAPVAVRYAWKDDPKPSLYNGSGLPASPFRTDMWPTKTTGLR